MKNILIASLVVLSMILSGCFEVVEEITINDDGSGQITMTVNLSRSKTKLSSIMLMDSINNYKVPSRADITTNIEKMIAEINKVSGVSNVSHSIDHDEFIYSVSCDFTNVDALNKVITHFSTEGHSAAVESNKQFVYDADRKEFTRNYHYNLSKEIKKVRQQDKEVLEDASITTIYRFESPIASSENANAKIAGNKKAIMLKVAVPDMINNTKDIKNTITLN